MSRRRKTRRPYGGGTVYEKRPGAWVVAWREDGRRRYSKAFPTRELAEVIRWNRAQAAGAREMAARARAAGRDEGAVLAREQSALFHDQVADRAEAMASEARQDAPAALPGAAGADT